MSNDYPMNWSLRLRRVSFSLLFLLGLTVLPVFTHAAEVEWQRHWTVQVNIKDGFTRPTFYRQAVCPTGEVVIVVSDRSGGQLQFVRAVGSLALAGPVIKELAETTALSCAANGRIYTAGAGWLRSFKLQDSQLVPVGSFFISGGATRILVVQDQVFVLGPWRLNRTRTIVRRFRLPEGNFEGSLTVDLPVSIGNFVNRLAYEGFLLWDSSQQRVLYMPGNPVGFYAFAVTGERLAEVIPRHTHLQPVSDRMAGPGPIHPRDVDHVMAAAVLPNGNILLFVVPGRNRRFLPEYGGDGSFQAHLELWSFTFQLLADNIPYPRGAGLLIGADQDGHLYFANPRPMESKVLIAKLSAAELLR